MEEWRVISDYPNYSVSNFGNIKNINRDKFMKLNLKGGYYSVSLINKEHRKIFKVHRLVALAFIPNPDNKTDVNHEDKNKLNNNVNNLSWMTRKENNQHKSVGLVYKSNKNKPVVRLSLNEEILETYNSIEEGGKWAFENKLTNTLHNGRNAIGKCVNGLIISAYGFKWRFIDNSLDNEEWREINLKNILDEGFLTDKKYYVSNLGRFKNSFGCIMDNYKTNENGYIRVYIYKKTLALHRLVALTFLDNPEKKQQVNHKDGNKLNNRVDNLEWCSNTENQKHKFQLGLGNNFTRKVKQYDLNWKLIKEYNSIALAAKEMNISTSGIRSVLQCKRKTSAGFIWKYSEDDNLDISEKITINKNKGRNIGQYDVDLNLIKIHKSISQASKNTGIQKNNIWAVIKNLRKTSGGYIWKYLD